MFEEEPNDFEMALSRCHNQRCLVKGKAPGVYVLEALNEQELGYVV